MGHSYYKHLLLTIITVEEQYSFLNDGVAGWL